MATLASTDVLVARVYVGMPFLGKNQTLLRVRRAGGEGWCWNGRIEAMPDLTRRGDRPYAKARQTRTWAWVVP